MSDWPEWLNESVLIRPGASISSISIDDNLIKKHGPVSAEIAIAMANAIRIRSGATYGLATSEMDLLESNDDNRKVGFIYIALTSENFSFQRKLRVFGDQGRIQRMSAAEALDLLRRKFSGLLEPIVN